MLSDTTLTVDQLLRIGPGRLANIEFVTTVKRDLVTQLLGYRFGIMRAYPDDVLTQHVIVLGDGTVRGHDDFERQGFRLDLDLLYLRQVPPETFLADPRLAPFAALGKGGPGHRADVLRQAMNLIHSYAGSDQSGDSGALSRTAAVLGLIRVDVAIIERILKEVGMSVAEFEDVLRLFRAAGWLQPVEEMFREQGRQLGQEQGLLQGRTELLETMIGERLGDGPDVPELARRLAGWPVPAALAAVARATTLDDLRAARPPV